MAYSVVVNKVSYQYVMLSADKHMMGIETRNLNWLLKLISPLLEVCFRSTYIIFIHIHRQ